MRLYAFLAIESASVQLSENIKQKAIHNPSKPIWIFTVEAKEIKWGPTRWTVPVCSSFTWMLDEPAKCQTLDFKRKFFPIFINLARSKHSDLVCLCWTFEGQWYSQKETSVDIIIFKFSTGSMSVDGVIWFTNLLADCKLKNTNYSRVGYFWVILTESQI